MRVIDYGLRRFFFVGFFFLLVLNEVGQDRLNWRILSRVLLSETASSRLVLSSLES